MGRKGRLASNLLLAAAVFVVWAGTALAQSAAEFLKDGNTLIGKSDYGGALIRFIAAERAGKGADKARAQFYQGVALNRLGRHRLAFERLLVAQRSGVEQAALDFEIGWAALQTRQWSVALARLQQLERSKKGTAKSVEFLGRTYAAMGQLAKAEASLREAIRRDPAVAPTVNAYLTLIARQRGDNKAAGQAARALFTQSPKSGVVRALRDIRSAQEERERNWSSSASLSFGKNDNVLFTTDDELNLPTDASGTSSPFTELNLDVRYDRRITARDFISAGYGGQGNFYWDISDANSHSHLLYVDYLRRLMPGLDANVRASVDRTFIDNDGFNYSFDLSPSVIYRAAPWLSVQGRGAIGMVTFDDTPTAPEQDRDSVFKTLGFDAILAPEDIRYVRLRLGFQRSWNDSDGSDFRYGSMGGYAGVNLSLPGLFNVDTVYSRTRVDYTEENSLAFNGVVLGAFPRHDFTDRWNIRITRRIVRGVTGFGEYAYTDNESNIGAFSYHQNIWKIGALARF